MCACSIRWSLIPDRVHGRRDIRAGSGRTVSMSGCSSLASWTSIHNVRPFRERPLVWDWLRLKCWGSRRWASWQTRFAMSGWL